MSKIILFLIFIPALANAMTLAELPTQCPTGYNEITEDVVLINDGETCPDGYFPSLEPAPSCLNGTDDGTIGNCYMYIGPDITFEDDIGTFSFETVCPLE